MRSFGRLLQFIGLAILPVAMFLELTGAFGRRVGLADLLIALVFGVAAFYIGRLVEGYSSG